MSRLVLLVLVATLGVGPEGLAEDPAAARVYHAARPGSLVEAQRRLAAGDREIRDAVVCHFDPGQAPPLIRLHHVRQELLAL